MEVTVAFNGDKLRSLRLERGLTQAGLAHRAHVRERQIIRWENAQHVPRAEAIVRLARALGVPVAQLLSEEDDDEGEFVSLDDLIRRRVEFHIRRALANGVAERAVP
jgi:transcriptional regulator with XRE-family HTH domain